MTASGESPILGLLPALGGGLTPLAATGQASRLLGVYFPAYLEKFGRLYYFSYQNESLSDFSTDESLLAGVSVVPKRGRLPYHAYALWMPFAASHELRRCAVLRVFQATGAIPAIIARRRYGIPYAVTYGYRYHAFASVERHHVTSLLLRLLEPLALRRAAAVIVTTWELADYVGRIVPADRVHLIPNGVDTTLFSPRRRGRPDMERRKTVLFVGRLSRQKNLLRLVEAVGILSRRHDLRLQFVGSGPMQRELEDAAARQRVCCSFEGVAPHERLPDYLNQVDVFVLPSLVEGHPKVLLEAMSCALPCVVSDCEGNRALIAHETTGLLFEATEVDEMANQIERVLLNRDLGCVLGRAARCHICAGYDLHQLVDREAALLMSLADAAEQSNSRGFPAAGVDVDRTRSGGQGFGKLGGDR